MANFYALNTPFINYFFYKAPFISDAYSLTDLSLLDGGTGYNLDDIIILGGGNFTNPAVIQVTNITAGVITDFIITQNGKYTLTPSGFSQLGTNGIGINATFNNLIFVPNLLPPGPNVPLAGGFIYFYEDDNRTVQANTYSDVFDPLNPVINPNPVQLGAAGNIPPIYLEDRYYYIVITDSTGDEANPVQVLEHYNPAEEGLQPTAFNDNFIVNPQFNYPIQFWKTTDEVGEITQPITPVAWGWEFLEDENTTTKNYVTVDNITGQGVEGSPINQIVLNSSTVSGDESIKDFRTYLGPVDFYALKNLTFSAQLISLRPQGTTVEVLAEYYYGLDGNETIIDHLTTFTVGTSRNKFSHSFLVNSIAGKSIGEGNYLAIRIRPSLESVCQVGMTNDMCLPGIQLDAVFNDEPFGFSKGEILGAQTDIDNAGLNENYSFYYYKNGNILPWADTGTIVLETDNAISPFGAEQPFRVKCDGGELVINQYSESGIPYRRLYDVIGDTYGGGGTLEAIPSGNTVIATSSIGGVPHSAWTDFNAGVSIVQDNPGLSNGLKATLVSGQRVNIEYTDMFAAAQTPFTYTNGLAFPYTPIAGVMSYWSFDIPSLTPPPITVTTVSPGSGSTLASVNIDFSTSIVTTRTRTSPTFSYIASSFIDYPIFAINNRGHEDVDLNFFPVGLMLFSLDGFWEQNKLNSQTPGIIVPFKSTNTLAQNLRSLVQAVNTKFKYTVTFTRLPAASQYWLYSDINDDFTAWYTVDGIGTDPAVAGRTSVPIAILSSFTLAQVAIVTADAINQAAFNVPDLDATAIDSHLAYYINL